MSYSQNELDQLAQRYTDAWNSRVPESVSAFHVQDSKIIINNGDPFLGKSGVTEMAAGFIADVPDLTLRCDGIRGAGTHVVYMWTFTGHHAQTGNPLDVQGWEEWNLDDQMMVTSSLGWFDAQDYDRQVAG